MPASAYWPAVPSRSEELSDGREYGHGLHRRALRREPV